MTNASRRVFVHAFSFEERCVTALRAALERDKPAVVVSFDYTQIASNLRSAYDAHRRTCRVMIEESGALHRVVECEHATQLKPLRELQLHLRKWQGEITLDISCLTKLHTLRVLHELYGRIAAAQYVGAGRHVPRAAHGHLGHRECVPVVGYQGVQRAGAPLVAVVLAGFEGDRALSSYLELDPALAVSVIGVPWIGPRDAVGYIETAWAVNQPLLAHHNVFAELAPSLSPSDFASRLREIVVKYAAVARSRWGAEPNIVVVPLCTKVQALGLYFYWTHHPRVRVLYPMPYEYDVVARGAGDISLFRLREYGRRGGADVNIRQNLANGFG